jgi:hypothetical protein
MRNLITTLPAALLIATTACSGGPGDVPEPPILKVTSPQRSLVKQGSGDVVVTGIVTPNAEGVPVKKVTVNNVSANLEADGSWQATIQVNDGASFIETVALDEAGGKATDTRAVHAGQVRTAGGTIDNAVTAAMSTQAFARISAAAGGIVKGLDIAEMLAPLQPMQHSGDENGPDCLYERVYINDVKFNDVQIQLIPQQGGIGFRFQVDGLDVPGRADYAVACLDGSTNVRVTASQVVVAGTLLVSPNGMQGFKTDLVDQDITLTGLNVSASGIPGTIMGMISWDGWISSIISKGAEMAMEPMMNSALGGLAGPKTLNVLGKTLTMEVSPSDISFDATGALVTMDMAMAIGGAERAQYVHTANGQPGMDPGNGFQLGLADDLANMMMTQANAIGLLNLEMPAKGGTFDSTEISMTLPPMISADPADGSMRIFLGDMIATFKSHGTPVAKAAVNAKLDLKINTTNNGYAVAIELGKPQIQFDILDDIGNETRMSDDDLAAASEACLDAQIAHISALLVNIPLPSIAGLQMRNLSVGSDNGYVMVKGTLE